MISPRRRLGLAGTMLVTVTLVAVGGGSTRPAVASCAQDSRPDGAPVVFVGRAEEERRGFTRFAVTEVWAGPDLAPEVWVRSGQEQPPWPLSLFGSVGSSVDAEFEPGASYVVGTSEDFVTTLCTSQPLTERAAQPAAAIPSDARAPSDRGTTGLDPPLGVVGQSLWGAGAMAVLVAGIVFVRRQRGRL